MPFSGGKVMVSSDEIYDILDQIQDAMRDNPSGQGDELTPFILIRPLN